ncbi:MAG: S8 family serine peptidase [Gemmatimonadetes bacterium]|nr:S8 family serine peptidase [Gemmatimonadota bacterium]
MSIPRSYPDLSSVLRVTVLFALLVSGSAGAEYVSYYNDDAVPLTLDATQVAVRMESDPAGVQAEFEALGLEATGREAMAVASWYRIPVAGGLKSDAQIEALVASLASRSDVAFASPVFAGEYGPSILTENIMVLFDESVSAASAEGILFASAGAAYPGDADWADIPGAWFVELATKNGFEALAIANDLALRPQTRAAEPDMIVTGQKAFIPNDTFWPNLWGLNNTGQTGGTNDQDMDAAEAWDVTFGSASIPVAIFDVGTQQNHPDLNLITGVDVTSEGPGDGGPVNSFDNHGTGVTGCVSGIINNALGITGVAPFCPSFSVRMGITTNSAGSFTTSFSWIVNGLTQAEAAGCRVSNHSYEIGATSATFEAKLTETRNNGMVHFVATGNSGAGSIAYPASVPAVNAVGSVDHNGNRSSFSQFGAGIDFTAPGETITMADRTGADGYVAGDYATGSGTSLASPYAAGVAALALSLNPTYSAADVEQLMQVTAVDRGPAGYDTEYGYGFVNANNVVLNTDCPAVMDVTPPALAYSLMVDSSETHFADITIQNVAGATCSDLHWTITEEAVPGGGDCAWLSFSSTSGSATSVSVGSDIHVTVDATGLAGGTYNCNAIINSIGGQADTVAISLTVTCGPEIVVNSSVPFPFSVPMGGTDSANLQFKNEVAAVCDDLIWTITEDAVPGGGDCNWLTVAPAAGVTAPQAFALPLISVDAFGLAPGVYTCNLEIASNDLSDPLVIVPVELTVTGSIANATKGVCYGTQGYNGSGSLVTINPATGAATIIGDTRVGGMPGLAINSLGEMYGVGGSSSAEQDLWRIDAATGAVVYIGPTGVQCFQAMAFDENDVLYGIGNCGDDLLFVVNTATGAVTPGPAVYPDMVGMAFDPVTGALLGAPWHPLALDTLFTIDTGTGITTAIGSLGLGLGIGIGDIHFNSSGFLFGVVGGGANPNNFVSIDKSTGAATIIGPTGVTLTGLAFALDVATSTPESTPLPVPLAHALHGATPNPFNPVTSIRFDMPAAGRVTINVFDTAGRRVATLVDGVRAAGVHDVPFHGDGLASGLYFYEMRTEDYRESRKMMRPLGRATLSLTESERTIRGAPLFSAVRLYCVINVFRFDRPLGSARPCLDAV